MDGWMEKAIDRDKEKNRDRDGDSNHRKFRSQTSDKDRCSNSGGSSQRRDTIRRKKIKVAEKVKKVAMHCVFLMFSGSGGSKRWLAKAVGAEPSGEMRNEKLHAVAARNTCGSQNVRT